ncbi:MAG: hypothetical protein HY928_05880 [Elusimicrobia bacterium]|nr:hypothetical protein [Elusimicrobiota bacterium]
MKEAPAPLDKEKLLSDSRQFRGGLGVLSFAVVRALRQAGAPPETVKGVLDAMVEGFPALSGPDCAALCDVLYARLGEERAATGGRWYPGT